MFTALTLLTLFTSSLAASTVVVEKGYENGVIQPDRHYKVPKGVCSDDFGLNQLGCGAGRHVPPVKVTVTVTDSEIPVVKISDDLSGLEIRRRGSCDDEAKVIVTPQCKSRFPRSSLEQDSAGDEDRVKVKADRMDSNYYYF